jgi:GNAT superfamily N-acetyltransferase
MFKFEALTRQHRRKEFDCGVVALNDYLASMAFQHSQKGLSKTFVLVDDAQPFEVIGFFTLTLSEIDAALLPEAFAKKLPSHHLPVIKLARLAVAIAQQGQGMGEVLLFEALARAYGVYQVVGAVALFVDAKDEWAAVFYQKYGFIAVPSYPLQLFLPFNTLAELLTQE